MLIIKVASILFGLNRNQCIWLYYTNEPTHAEFKSFCFSFRYFLYDIQILYD